MSTGQTPQDDYGKPVLALWDDAAQKAVPVHIKSQVTGADGKQYAIIDVNASLAGDNLRVNAQAGDFVAGSIVDLATLAAIVSASKAAVKAGAGDFADLATIAGAITANLMQANVSKIGGQVPTLDNTTIQAVSMRGKGTVAGDTSVQIDTIFGGMSVEQFIQYHILQGHGFSASAGTPASSTNGSLSLCSLSLFNPSNSGKNILIYSIQCFAQDSNLASNLRLTTTDPSGTTGFTNTFADSNLKAGSGTTSGVSLSSTATGATASVTPTGTIIANFGMVGFSPNEILSNGAMILLPNGSAEGIEVITFVGTAGHTYSTTAKYIAF